MNKGFNALLFLVLLLSLAACKLETRALFADSSVSFKQSELIGSDGPEPFYLRVFYHQDNELTFYAAFQQGGHGMLGRIECDKRLYRVVDFLIGTSSPRLFRHAKEMVKFSNFAIGIRWLYLAFDKPILKMTLPYRIYLAACSTPVA